MQAQLIERLSTYSEEDQNYIVDSAFNVLEVIFDKALKEYNDE